MLGVGKGEASAHGEGGSDESEGREERGGGGKCIIGLGSEDTHLMLNPDRGEHGTT